LIETLHRTEQRLEKLTAGEVDTVADRDGRTFLLRRAQDRLRLSEAAKQADTLDALAQSEAGLHRAQLLAKLAHLITGLDGVFERWSENLPQLVGVEPAQLPRTARAWLDILHPDDRSLFREKAVEAGVKKTRVEVEYRLRRGDGRWIHMRQTMEPLKGEGDGAGGSRWFNTLQDVTLEKEAAEDLRRSKSLKGAILESSLDGVITIDHEGKILEFNPAAEAAFGLTREQALGKVMVDLIVPPRLRDAHRRGFAHYLATGKGPILGKRLELEAIRADGTEFPIELAITTIGGTSTPMFTGFIRDITARKEAEEKLKRLNRVYAVLSGINSLIVRAGDRNGLFREASRVAVEHGGFRMAWIGVVDKQAGIVKPVAFAGDVRDFFESAPLAATENNPGGLGLAGRAIGEMKPMISNDVRNDPQRLMKKKLEERGINSLAVIPLIVGDEAVGVLALYSADLGFFDDEEMRLLQELGGDISFAIDHIDKAEKLGHITRVNAMLSGINGAIVRVRGRDELLRETCRIAIEQGGFPMTWIGMVDRSVMKIVPIASAGMDEELLAAVRARVSSNDGVQLGNNMAGRAIREKKAGVSNDAQNDPRLVLSRKHVESGVCSMAMLPLIVSDEAVGVLVLYSAETGFFDEEEMKLLTELAGDIAFALEHIGKAEKLDRVTRVNAMLSGINGAIVRIRDRQQLFAEACRIAVETGGLRFAWLCVVDEAGMRLRPVASAGADDGFLETIRDRLSLRDDAPEAHGIGAKAVRERRAFVLNDVEADADLKLKYKKTHADRGVKSVAAFPLLIAGKAVGAFALHAGETGFFDDDEMKLLNEVAGNIAFALEHIEKEEKVQRMTRVQAVLSGINTLIVRVHDRDELYREACRVAVEHGKFRMAWIGVVDRSAMKIVPVASAGAEPEFLTLVKDRFSLREDAAMGNTMTARAVREKKAIVSNEIRDDSKVLFAKERIERGISSMAILPLLVSDNAVGVLALYADEPGFFDEEELSLLTELAGDIAFALANISRQQTLDKLARMRAVSGQINAAIVRTRERKALLEETCRIASEHGKFEMIWIGAIDHDAQQVQPLAWKGFSEEAVRAVSWASIGAAKGTLGEAMQTRKASVRNDIEGELPGGKLRHEALKLGRRSSVCLPLVVDDRVVALIVLFAHGTGFFDEEELALLNEVAADVSFALQAIEKQKKLDYLSYYDVLTGLANRTLFLERVAQYMRSAVSGGHKLAIGLIDLERFKNINDSLGRPAGDALLKQMAEWLTRNLGDANLLARLGADHFAVVLPEIRQEGDVAPLVEKLVGAFLEHPFRLNDAEFRVAPKVGVALFPDDGVDADTLFKNAEAALKKAKASGERYLFYTQKMTETVAGKLTLENQLRQALDKEEFVLHYQPKVSLVSGKVTGAEALIRWNDPRTGLVPPGRFIPVLEETGLIYDVGRWALRRALEDYLRWRAAGLAAVRVAVNVSPLQLRNRGFIAEIEQAIGIDANAPAGLELEITESLIMDDVRHNIASLQAIRALGVTIAIDDFGTGFSSLSYLAKLPVDTLKIDRSFVIDMTAGAQGLALVSTIITLAHSLKLKVVAEGVETEEQSRLLRSLDCDEMQGFLFSKPVPSEIFETRYLAQPLAAARSA